MNTKINKNTELNMLHGNIARISVTDDLDELQKMVFFANLRIYRLYEFKKEEIINKKLEEIK